MQKSSRRKLLRRRQLFLESLEPRQMLATVGSVEVYPDQSAVEAVRPGILTFTKTLTNPLEDYSATVYFTVGFFQEPDGDGGIAETDDSNYAWGNYSIELGIGQFSKQIQIKAPLDNRAEEYEDLFFYITSIAPVGDWDWSSTGEYVRILDAIPYSEKVPATYFCNCSCGCGSVNHEAEKTSGFVRANTQPHDPSPTSAGSADPASGSDGGSEQASLANFSGGLTYNSVSVASSLVGEIVHLSGGAGGANAISSKVILNPDTPEEEELDIFNWDPDTVSSSSDGYFQFVHVVDPLPVGIPALRTRYRLIVEEEGNDVWHVSEGVINRRGNVFPEFGAGWAPPFLQKLIFDPDGEGIFLAEGNGNLFWFNGILGVDTTFEPDMDDGDHGYSSIVRGDSEFQITNKKGNIAIFNADGQLIEWRDRNGNRTLFSYAGGRLDEVNFPTGRVLTYSYSGGIISSIADTMGPTVTFEHSGSDIISYTEPDPDGAGPLSEQTTTFTYVPGSSGDYNLLESITDPANNLWTYSYEPSYGSDRVASLVSPNNVQESFQPPLLYGLGGGALLPAEGAQGSYIDPHGQESILKVNFTEPYAIGWLGLLTEHIDPLGNVTKYERDRRYGYLLSVTYPDPDGAGPLGSPVQSFEYDAHSGFIALTGMTLPNGGQLAWEYNWDFVIPTKFTDEFGVETLFTLDEDNGNVLEERIVIGLLDLISNETDDIVTTFTYTGLKGFSSDPPGGLVTGITDALSRVTEMDYDSAGNLTDITYAVGTALEASAHFDYDDWSQLVTVTDELGRETDYDYDGLKRPIELTLSDPDGAGPLARPVLSWQYNNLNQLVEEIDPLARSVAYAYDAHRNRTSVALPDHDGDLELTVTTFEYEHGHELERITDPLGRETSYEHDELGRVTSVTMPDPDGAGPLDAGVWQIGYDNLGRMIEQIDPLGNVTTYVYTGFTSELLVTLPDPDGAGPLDSPTIVQTFDLAGRLLTATDPLGGVTTYEYDELGRLITVTLPDPGGQAAAPVTHYEYDKVGNLRLVTDPLGNVTEYIYDERNRLVGIIEADPDGNGPQTSPEWEYAYDDAGQLVSATDPLGRETTWEYDGLGRLISQVLPDPDGNGPLTAPVTALAYDAASRLVSVTDPLGNVTEYEYDVLDNLIEVTQPDPDGGGSLSAPVSTYSYDAVGNLLEVTDPMSRITSLEYDDLDRMTKVTEPDPDGGGPGARPFSTFTYDAVGNLLSVADPLSHVTAFAYDNLHRRTLITDAQDGETSFTYDAAGQLLTLTDPVGNTTQWDYDGLGRVTSETNELGKTRSFAYDAASNLIERVDRLGRKTTYEYDNVHRLTAENWLDGNEEVIRTLSFGYDAASQLLAADDPAASYAYEYDGLGRLTSETQLLDGLSFGIEYQSQYDLNSNRTGLLALLDGAADFKNTYLYDNLDRLTNLTQESGASGPGANVVAEKRIDFGYDASGAFTRIDRYADREGFEFVASSFYSYDGMGRLTKLTHNESPTPASGWGTDPLAGYQFTYDAASRITSIDSYVDGLSEFDYDASNQLTAADHTGQSDEGYTYDANGNRTGGGYDVDPNNQLASDGTYNYTYDDEGNRLTKTKISNGEREEYEWDHRNRLTKITFKNGGGTVIKTVDQTYDVFNRWIRRTVDPDGATGSAALVDSFFSWEDGQINLQFDGDDPSDLTDRYLWGPAIDQILADESVDSLLSAGDVVWPLADHLGTPRDLAEYNSGTDDTSIANHRRYNTFGVLVSETNGSITTIVGFTGAIYDATIGLNLHRRRWLDLATGRWMSEDPIGFGGDDANLGRYVENSPLAFVDPWGLESGTIGPAPPWYQRWYAEFLGRVKYRKTFIDDPRKGGGSPGLFHWIVGNLYHRTPIGDVVDPAVRTAVNPIGEMSGQVCDAWSGLINLPRLPKAWDEMSDLDRQDILFKTAIGIALGKVPVGEAAPVAEGFGSASKAPSTVAKGSNLPAKVSRANPAPRIGSGPDDVIPNLPKKKVPNPHGSPGAPDHKAAVDDLLDEFKADYPQSKGYNVVSNKSIESETGLKRRPDVSVKKDGNVVEVGEVPRANKDGSLVSRERIKTEEYNDAQLKCRIKPIPKLP